MVKIHVTAAEVSPGVSKKTGKPYTKYVVKASDNTEYSTFDLGLYNIASACVGGAAEITFEQSQFGFDLKSIVAVAGESNGAAAPAETWPESDMHTEKPDWDAIARGKTKSLLWGALYSGPLLQGLQPVEAGVIAESYVNRAMLNIFGDLEEDIPF